MTNVLRTVRKLAARSFVKVHKAYLRTGGVEIGSGGLVSPFAQIDMTRGTVEIGDDVYITAGSRILSHSAIADEPSPHTVIEDDVFVGVNSVVLPDVTIGEDAVVGAGSVVTDDVEAGAVVAGNPAEKIRDKSDSGGD